MTPDWMKGEAVQAITSSATEARQTGNKIVVAGISAIVVILLLAAILLFLNLPDANAFNARVERVFVDNNLTTQAEIKLLEILAQSGTAFSEVLQSYRSVIFVLLVFATALLLAAFVFLVTIVALNRRMSAIQRSGIQVDSLLISREALAVYINDMEFALTEASLETLAVLAEARMDDEVLTGAQIVVLNEQAFHPRVEGVGIGQAEEQEKRRPEQDQHDGRDAVTHHAVARAKGVSSGGSILRQCLSSHSDLHVRMCSIR